MTRFSLALAIMTLAAPTMAGVPWCGPVDLDQNWTCETAARFWFTSQGSQVIPFKWFLNLEEAHSTDRFASDKNLVTRFGYIAVPDWAKASVGSRNPGNLPIGFTLDGDANTGYVGLTCAACHTAQFNFPGQTEPLLINGGQGLPDFEKFGGELADSLEATLADPAKFQRFAAKVGTWPGGLRAQLQIETGRMRARLDYNRPPSPSGFGRVDAFGQIFNQIVAWSDGPHPADAPVSYPSLWLAPQQLRVQWNGIAHNDGDGPFIRNLGEVMGVFARFKYVSTPLVALQSSVSRAGLDWVEEAIKTLQPPKWPGEIRAELKDAGAEIYLSRCVTCHALNDRTMTNPAQLIPVWIGDAQTDSRMAEDFQDRSWKLKGKLRYWPDGVATFKTAGLLPVPGQAVLGLAMLRVWAAKGGPTLNPESLADNLTTAATTVFSRDTGYKAGPLNGIWATAPYLHNGSVSSLMELFSASRTPAGFCVGTRTFDPANVGLMRECAPEETAMDLTRPGNGNAGHKWGTDLTDTQKAQLIEYLKSL